MVMAATLTMAMTADLHWGTNTRGDAATQLMIAFLRERSPDWLILAGDIGAGQHFEECLQLFDNLSCQKALVPGNHDIWVQSDDPRGDSLRVYRNHLPELCVKHHFHYLDQAPVMIPQSGLGAVGSINWYDYSWCAELLRQQIADWETRLRTKVFSRGRHNDARFVRWDLDDPGFTDSVVSTLKRHLEAALTEVNKVIVVTHHPPFCGLSFPRIGPPSLDSLLWDAFSGNRKLEEILSRHADQIAYGFCGHTHCARENTWKNIRGYNIGGDYHFKRLLLLAWPEGKLESHIFGNPDARY